MNKFIELFTDECPLRQFHEKIQRTHIFHKMVKHYVDRLTETDTGLLYMQYENVEIALALSRRRDLHSAELIFQKVAAQQLEYPHFIRDGMLSVRKAAAAYYEYACGRHAEAVELLEQAIRHTVAQSRSFPLILVSALDQWRNIVVVRLRQGDLNGALSELNALISFCLTGKVSGMGVKDRFHFDAGGVIGDRFWQLGPEMHHLLLSNITGDAFQGTMEYCNNDFSLAGNYFGQIIMGSASAIQGRRVVKWARSPIMLLHLFYTGQTERFLEGISGQFDDVRQAIPPLQWLIISNYVILLREAGFDLESHPNYKRLLEAYRSTRFNTDLLKPAVQEKG